MTVLVVLAGGVASADVCKPRAELAGDPVAIARVEAELAALGVERGQPSPGCAGVHAQVELAEDGGIAVAIRDGARRSEGRVVGDPAVAASWIDSWLRDELDGTSWLVATPVPVKAPARTPMLEMRDVVPAPAPRPRFVDRLAVSVAYEQSYLSDGAEASGASVAACLLVGRACVGARVRFASEPGRVVNLTAMTRGETSALATASLPIAVGRMMIVPELGAGLGKLTTRRDDGCATTTVPPQNCDPMDPNCMAPVPQPDPVFCEMEPKVVVGDGFAAHTYAPRLAATLRVTVPLFERVWLEGLAGATVTPFAHGDVFPVETRADGTAPGGVPPDQVALPGEPSSALVLGIGLRVGVP